MTSLPRVAVVVLNFNGAKLLPEFLPSVFNSTYPNLRLVLGDNGSTDQSISWVKENYSGDTLFPEINFSEWKEIQSVEKTGFSYKKYERKIN